MHIGLPGMIGRTMAESSVNSAGSHWLKPLSPFREVAAGYGWSALALALGAALRVALGPILGPHVSYMFFVPAILIGSAAGGWTAGIFATVLGLGIGLFFVADASV